MMEMLGIFKALSEESRLRIISLLRDGELCVCDIFTALNMSQPKISFHLNVLKEAGLIKDRKQGKWIHYSINDADLFRRFLISSVIERIPADTIQDDRKRLDAFIKTREKKAAVMQTGKSRGCCER